jgi:hypothetical protein
MTLFTKFSSDFRNISSSISSLLSLFVENPNLEKDNKISNKTNKINEYFILFLSLFRSIYIGVREIYFIGIIVI